MTQHFYAWIQAQENRNRGPRGNLYTHFQSSINLSLHKVEIMQIPINGRTKWGTSHARTSCGSKQEGTNTGCGTDEPQIHDVK